MNIIQEIDTFVEDNECYSNPKLDEAILLLKKARGYIATETQVKE